MKFVITGSLGNISKPLSLALINAGHQVTIVTSKSANAAAIEALGATAAVGSVEDVDFLTATFSGADAVYTMIPPKWDAADWKAYIGGIGANYTAAIAASGVKKVVNLSSIGAHLPEGCGPVTGLYRAEQSLNTLTDVAIRHLRPAYFFTNLFANIGLIKHLNVIGSNFGEQPIALVHPTDIAAVAAEELLSLSFTGHSVNYIVGDERTGNEIASVLGTAIGQPDLPWVVFSDEQSLQGAIGAGLSHEVASNYTEMGTAMRSGAMSEDFLQNRNALTSTKLEDFAPAFAAAFHA
ncbi:NAD(P)H-binding protein [Limnovirga soli]|uniref:NAD(P)H-binding protein n=1 Tax=Limnovirga soli TaxID=2656915 RepID=A0A8J8FJ43_9BACT|nr:NAD(P)H-binding protein [Limnovirga soli]NNV56791.1 NAD(P)H-binding protein [Limnovirga soli]